MFLLLLLSLGFAQIPGIALGLGAFIFYLGIRVSLGGNSVWIPNFLSQKKLPPYFLTKIIEQTLKLLKLMKRWSHPRYQWTTQKSVTRRINGIMIAIVGLCLTLCPPVPLTGTLASLAIFLIVIGLLNEDGVYIILGYVFSLAYLITTLFLMKHCSLSQIFGWIKNLFY